MYYKTLKALAIFGIVLIHFGPAYGQTSSAEEKILLDIENQRTEAIANKNSGTLNTIYHDQFRGVTATGAPIDKKGLIETLKSIPSDATFTTEDMKASIYGYAGVTSGKMIQKNKGGLIVAQTRFMNVYAKRSGKWMIVEAESTLIQP